MRKWCESGPNALFFGPTTANSAFSRNKRSTAPRSLGTVMLSCVSPMLGPSNGKPHLWKGFFKGPSTSSSKAAHQLHLWTNPLQHRFAIETVGICHVMCNRCPELQCNATCPLWNDLDTDWFSLRLRMLDRSVLWYHSWTSATTSFMSSSKCKLKSSLAASSHNSTWNTARKFSVNDHAERPLYKLQFIESNEILLCSQQISHIFLGIVIAACIHPCMNCPSCFHQDQPHTMNACFFASEHKLTITWKLVINLWSVWQRLQTIQTKTNSN